MQSKKLATLLLLFAFLSSSLLYADEGMWTPYKIGGKTFEEMQKAGLKITAEELFSFNQSSLKDAIVHFGGGCTGEMISKEGLLLTNHHCGLGQIQAHSSPENDYLKNGFWAKSRQEELSNPGLTVSFLEGIEDVTDKMLKGISPEMRGEERSKLIINNRKALMNELHEDDFRYTISSFYNGNQYLLFTYQVYKDVRLVGCPPFSIGKFGADTDNWTWPRHTGDFCIFRVYTAPDGSPAEYSESNVPMNPKRYLKFSTKGIKEGDYTMILGYPGRTERYSSSAAVLLALEQTSPSIVACRSVKLDVIHKYTTADNDLFIKYASKQASISNYWKYSIGQIKQLQRHHVVEKRKEQETKFLEWASRDITRMHQYGSVIDSLDKGYAVLKNFEKARVYAREAGYRGSEAVTFAGQQAIVDLNNLLHTGSRSQIETATGKVADLAPDFFKNYSIAIDREMTSALLALYCRDISAEQLPPFLLKEYKSNKGNFTKYVDNAFKKSVFTSQERFDKWIANPKAIDKDPVYVLMHNFYLWYDALGTEIDASFYTINDANRIYINGLMEMDSSREFYPDANSTMRLTYGKVAGYAPADAVTLDYQTFLDGVMEKEIPGDWEFSVPDELKALYREKDFGRYGVDNRMPVAFVSNNDITGGNSGSAVLDGEGNIVGLAFDGNWEAMSGDILFDKAMKRTISVDARYILFVIDKYAKSEYIMKELEVVE